MWRRVVVSLRHVSVFRVVWCGVGWCRVVPGIGFAMPRRVLFCGGWLCGVVLPPVTWCCVVFVGSWGFLSCDVVVYRSFLSCAALQHVVSLCCVACCGAVRHGVSCLVLGLGGVHGLRQSSCCRVVRFSPVCLCRVARFVVLLCVVLSGLVCCVEVGLVLGYVLSCCVVPCHVVWWRVL